MTNLKPLSISKPAPNLLESKWQDGFHSVITLQSFRDNCPCAVCVDERGKHKANPNVIFLGKYDLKKLETMGNYAVGAVWGDKHDSGIYDWEYFRNVFENNALSNDQIDEYKSK